MSGSRYLKMGKAGRASLPESLRRHFTPLEMVHRGHFGTASEAHLELSATSLATMLQEIADCSDATTAYEIHAIVRALRGEDPDFKLVLQQNRRARHVTLDEHTRRSRRQSEWLEILAKLEREGVKTEAAIATIAEQYSVSRASVFAGIKEAERWLERFQSLALYSGGSAEEVAEYDNPRPAKSRKG